MWLYIPSTCAADTTGSGSHLTLQQAEALARSVMWRSKCQQPRFWQTLWTKGFYSKRLSGPTCEPSTLAHGAGLWILSLQGIRVNHSQSPESVVAKAIRGTCGPKWLESWRNANQLLVSSRTSEDTLGLDSIKSPKTWNDWATALRRVCLQRRKLAQATRENGFSSWPTAKTATGDYQYANGEIVLNLSGAVKDWATPASADCVGSHGGGQGRSLRTDIAKNWATPQAFDANDCTRLTPCEKAGCRTLANDLANWPTPKTNEANSPGVHGNGGQDLRTVVSEKWPTARANELAGRGRARRKPGTGGAMLSETAENSQMEWRTPNAGTPNSTRGTGQDPAIRQAQGRQVELKDQVTAYPPSLQAQATSDGGESLSDGPNSRPQLNPRFVEWLMGVPAGWTSLECSETELSRYKALTRSALCRLCSDSVGQIE